MRNSPKDKKNSLAKNPAESPVIFPMRINKYLAWKKHSTSRREADTLIEKGGVLINNKKAVLGDKVIATDVVQVRFRLNNHLHPRP
ncbi:MAG: S4 domain-containing protein [Patescibacteria group bacterium]